MGLDLVEVAMRTEEVFAISLRDDDLTQADTVGGLYLLVCSALHLEPTLEQSLGSGTVHSTIGGLSLTRPTWTPDDVWVTLVALIVDQLQVPEEDVRFDAQWSRDLKVS